MAGTNPRSWVDRAVGVCLAVLVGAAALFIAVKLVEAIATALIVIIAVGLFIAAGVVILRTRNRGW